MKIDLYDLFKQSPALLIFMAIGLGYPIMDGEMVGKTQRAIEAMREPEFALVRLVRDGKVIELELDDQAKAGDKVAILAPLERHVVLRDMPNLTSGILDPELLDSYITTQVIVVSLCVFMPHWCAHDS